MRFSPSKMTLVAGIVCLASCSPQSASNSIAESASSTSSYAVDTAKQAVVSFKLVDAPNKEIKSVVVDIDHLEVVVAGSSKVGRLQLAKGMGSVDLLNLQNGISLPLQDIVAPHGLQIQQIRLILKDSGHYIIKGDNSVCELKTPSAQKTGVKIILTNKVQFEAGHQYSVTLDFDAMKSVVLQGNGGCLLKPVVKLISVTKQQLPEVVDPQPSPSATPEPPVEIITTPDENDPADDGWDYTPVVDNLPYVDESQLSDL